MEVRNVMDKEREQGMSKRPYDRRRPIRHPDRPTDLHRFENLEIVPGRVI